MASLKRVLYHVWQVVREYKYSFAFTFVSFGIALAVSNLYMPILVQRIIDIASGEAQGDVWRLVWTFGALLVFVNVLFRSFDYFMTYMQRLAMRDLSNYAFRHLVEHSYTFFSNEFTGSLVAKAKRFRNGFESIHDALMFRVWSAFIVLTGSAAILFVKDPLLGWLFIAFITVFLVVTVFMTRHKIKYDIAEAEADSKVTAQLADALTNILAVQMFARRREETARYEEVTHFQERALARNWNFSVLQWAVQGFMLMLLEFFALYYSVLLWEQGSITIGTIVLVQAYVGIIFGQVWNLGRALTQIVKKLSDMREMVDIIDIPVQIADRPDPVRRRVRKGSIVLEGVTFRYEDESDAVLEDFSLSIASGERIGLVGPSGAGKSTITKLLLRFVDVAGGAVSIDGVDVRDYSQDTLRNAIAYVPQDPVLFHRSIAENIGYGDPRALRKRIIAAAKKARAHEFIEDLPQGYETLVGERGVKLSGGERQRVAIARAMLKDAPILVMDEATSSLDTVSEKKIQEALEELMQGRTTIIIAHRLSTVRKMDRIVVMDGGAVVEQGTHNQLLRRKGLYHSLYTHQKL